MQIDGSQSRHIVGSSVVYGTKKGSPESATVVTVATGAKLKLIDGI